MSNYKIVRIGIEEFSKCSNIWDMEKCPYTDKFRQQIISGNRFVYICKVNGKFIGEGDLVINIDDSDYFIPNQRVYVSRMIVKRSFVIKAFASQCFGFL